MKTRSQIEDMVRNASYTRNVMTFLCQNNLDPDKVNRLDRLEQALQLIK